MKKFKDLYVDWQGIFTIMSGNWKMLPVRVCDFNWNDYDELESILNKEIFDSLIKYNIDYNRVLNYSILCDGSIVVNVVSKVQSTINRYTKRYRVIYSFSLFYRGVFIGNVY
jgi:hypothetical protein